MSTMSARPKLGRLDMAAASSAPAASGGGGENAFGLEQGAQAGMKEYRTIRDNGKLALAAEKAARGVVGRIQQLSKCEMGTAKLKAEVAKLPGVLLDLGVELNKHGQGGNVAGLCQSQAAGLQQLMQYGLDANQFAALLALLNQYDQVAGGNDPAAKFALFEGLMVNLLLPVCKYLQGRGA
jgi:hypothetical protein